MMPTLKRLCVYCGASTGVKPAYVNAARELAFALANAGIGIVYGGGQVGLMGEMANTMLKAGGEVIGVVPHILVEKEIAHKGVTQLHTVNSMHERKALMAELADGFILLPGGCGSLDEFFEVLTLRQLGFHKKPIGILNIEHYYDHLLSFLDHSVKEDFMYAPNCRNIIVKKDITNLLAAFESYHFKDILRWEKISTESVIA